MGVLEYAQEVHQLQRTVVASVPLVARGEIIVELGVDFTESYAQADGVAGVHVHQLAPQPRGVLAQLDNVEQRRLDERVEEVDEVVVVAVEEDVREREVAVARAHRYEHVGEGVEHALRGIHYLLNFAISFERLVGEGLGPDVGKLVGDDTTGHHGKRRVLDFALEVHYQGIDEVADLFEPGLLEELDEVLRVNIVHLDANHAVDAVDRVDFGYADVLQFWQGRAVLFLGLEGQAGEVLGVARRLVDVELAVLAHDVDLAARMSLNFNFHCRKTRNLSLCILSLRLLRP